MTPILAAVHPETLIWIVLLLIGAVSSIVSKGRQARRPAQKVQPRRDAPKSTVPQQRVFVPQPEPASVVVPSPQPRPPITKKVIPAPVTTPPPAPAHGTGGFRGMFDGGSIVRAIVAAEVLGPPKSLQEQSIWSPRHSEPSI